MGEREREREKERERERDRERTRKRDRQRSTDIHWSEREREGERERQSKPDFRKGGEFNARIRFHFWLCNTCYVIFSFRVPSQFFTFQLQL